LIYCATSRNVAGQVPEGVIEIVHSLNPSGCKRVLGSTQLLTNVSTRNHSRAKGGRCVGLTLRPSGANCLEIQGASTSCNPIGLIRPVMDSFYVAVITEDSKLA
jgi:hypothetical protein